MLCNDEIKNINYNWSQLSFMEAFYIKKYDPIIYHGLKDSKELLMLN